MLYLFRRSPWAIFMVGFLAGVMFWGFAISRISHTFSSTIFGANLVNIEKYTDSVKVGEVEGKLEPMVMESDHHGHHTGEDVLALAMAKKVRIFAMIFTMPASKMNKAVHVKATWAKRFNDYVFISSENDPSLPSLAAVTKESRNMLWAKTRFAIMHANKYLLEKFDFFMKADDDTYVIVENLRYLLADRDPEIPIVMGRRFKKYVKQGYLSGGAGYVMSRAAIKRIAEGLAMNVTGCEPGGGAEDVNLGQCAEATGVTLVDSLDGHGQECFHPFSPDSMIDKSTVNGIDWFKEYNHHKIVSGMNCCSDHSVSFHYIAPKQMYALEYLVYHLYPYGITRDLSQFEKLKNVTDV